MHGICSAEGQENVWNMKAPLERSTGLPVTVFEYGYLHPIQARFQNPSIAKRLAGILEPNDIIVCHSNGAAVTWLATCNEGARPDGVVLVQPALDPWRMPICNWADVVFNAGDEVTEWSKFLLGNIWGDMGKVGYKPKPGEMSNRVRQMDTINDAAALGMPQVSGHTAIFQAPAVTPWGELIGRRIISNRSHS